MDEGETTYIKRLAVGIAEGVAHAVSGFMHANVANEQTIRALRQENVDLRQEIDARDAQIRDLLELLTRTCSSGAQLVADSEIVADAAIEPVPVRPVVIVTDREYEVLNLLREEGLQNKIIAFRLKISESTVKVHLRNLCMKLNVSNRTALAVYQGEVRGENKGGSKKPAQSASGTVVHFPDGEPVITDGMRTAAE
jgi:DNA-binding NarL/FixJ family response regulator